MTYFRRWDRSVSRRVTRFVANSTAVADRIRAFYGRAAEIIFPPVRTDFFRPCREVDREDFFLYVGRLVAYKKPEIVVEAFSNAPFRLLVVGEGQMGHTLRARASKNVSFLGPVSDEQLRDLYRRARALVYPGNEDFGIVMAEAQACGTPVIGLAEGGARDIVIDGETGWLIDRSESRLVREAVAIAARQTLDEAAVRRNAERFSTQRFTAEISEVVGVVARDRG